MLAGLGMTSSITNQDEAAQAVLQAAVDLGYSAADVATFERIYQSCGYTDCPGCDREQTCIAYSFTTSCSWCVPPETGAPCENYAYIGCYPDFWYPRALPTRIDSGLSITACIKACADREYDYAGLQYYGECWCGTDYDMYDLDKTVIGFCNTACVNGPGICGGTLFNSVYATTPDVCPVFAP
jgi:hypothetical protein